MVPKHNKRSSSNEECCEHAYKHPRHMESGDMHIPAEFVTSDLMISGFKSKDNAPLENERSTTLESSCMCPSSNQELEVSKGDQNGSSGPGAFDSFKATKTTCGAAGLDHTECPERIPQHENEIQKRVSNSQQDLPAENHLVCTDKGIPVPNFQYCASRFEVISSKDGDLDRSAFLGSFKDDFRMPVVRHFEYICSPVFEFPYRKLVAIGPNHQADIPVCKQDGDDDNSDRWLGKSLIPMPDSSKLSSEVNLGYRKDCSCYGRGSIRCVRQHVSEARENLQLTIGEDTFKHLGFYDMGEDVAENWSGEEGLLFKEVVMSNPASLGRNFWDYLSQHFPTRSCNDLVSYYFNVFMLQKRALQNRFDPWNADSDNDEWQECDDSESGDEDDSIVESPPGKGSDIAWKNDSHMPESECSDKDSMTDESERESLCDLSRNFYSVGKNMHEYAGELDTQDDSCTSFDGQQHAGNSCSWPTDLHEPVYGLAEENKNINKEYKNDVLSVFNESGYDVGHCDLKTWDVGYICGSRKSVDFLPTCNVIEEVFGKAWVDGADDHSVN